MISKHTADMAPNNSVQTGSKSRRDIDEPEHIEPSREPAAQQSDARRAVLLAIGAIFASILVSDSFGGPMSVLTNRHTTTPIKIGVADFAGLIRPVDPIIANSSEHVLAALEMPKSEKDRLRVALQNSSMRIGAVVVWDTVDEDKDSVRITAAGFSQDLIIQHQPHSFFVPYLPGGSITIQALTDGGGGGVTLGVSTILGKLPLPHLAPGQSLEIQLP